MKRTSLAMIMAAAASAALAQSAIDAQQISQSDFKGTARFMSMGGAFTALGGDLSTMNQNPAGIGIYRSNEVGATLDINIQSTKTSPSYSGFPSSSNQTKVYCNNFGYVGATIIPGGGALKTFNWGASYNRAVSFDRRYRGYVNSTNTSLSNYIAYFSQGYTSSDLSFTNDFNPYAEGADWLSILAYNSYLINPSGSDSYNGLYQNGTVGDALYNVRETGRVDEYNISFGGNVENVVYWGLSVGITDLHYTRTIYYSESMADARIYNVTGSPATTTGDAGFDLNSRKYINGSGWNLKLGVILKPMNELRVGFAFHTPTWYHLSQGYDGTIDYSYYNPTLSDGYQMGGQSVNPLQGYEYTDDAYFQWHYRSPWKLMAGVAAVLGKQAILSLDYQYDSYGDMSIATPYFYDYGGWGTDFETNEDLRADIKQYFKGTSTIRVGAEYRVTPQFSLRAGYNYQTSGVKAEAAEGAIEVLTSGTDPSYNFTKHMQHITCGIGYKYQNWYIDAAYVYRQREGRYHAYTNFNGNVAPQSKIVDHNSSIVLSTGFKF
ncbi:MAG: outer membrane protein transport protein [Bacteroidales bacterium]|nr:outer membrane protein transport protein [Bacteroidales bacterium]